MTSNNGISISKRGNSFQVSYTATCKSRIRKSFKTKEEAEAFAMGVGGDVPTKLGPFIESQFNHIWGDSKRPEAFKTNCDVLLKYISCLNELSEIGSKRIADLVRDLKDSGKSGATINRKLSTLSRVLKRAQELEVIKTVPPIPYQKEGAPRERLITPKEFDALDEFFRKNSLQAYALFRFLYLTGCRLGEALKLKHIDWNYDYITFRGTKNGEDRTIPAHVAIYSLMMGLSRHCYNGKPPDNAPLFGDLTARQFRLLWNKAREELDISDPDTFVPHILRHTRTTELIRNGASLPLVSKWMGHKSIKTTMRYTHLSPDDLKGVASLIPTPWASDIK